MAAPARLVVGLGNPGPDYAFTRHNIGFMALDALASAGAWSRKFNAETRLESLAGVPCLLLKPLTFMNLSGTSVGEALRFYKLAPADVIVLHDDIDLLSGKVRVKQGGGHAGHNGLRSLDAHIGPDYWRVRLGIGRPERREQVHDYVLGAFAKSDTLWLEPLFTAIRESFPLLLENRSTDFASFVQRRVAGETRVKRQR